MKNEVKSIIKGHEFPVAFINGHLVGGLSGISFIIIIPYSFIAKNIVSFYNINNKKRGKKSTRQWRTRENDQP